jgi:hypothetical protein
MIAVTYSTNPIQNNTPKLDFPQLEATAAVACLPIQCLPLQTGQNSCSCLKPIFLYTKFQHAISYSGLYHKIICYCQDHICYVPTTNMPSPIVDSKSVLPEMQGSFPIFAEKCENL